MLAHVLVVRTPFFARLDKSGGFPLDRLKLEIAQELGLAEKIARAGWAELTAAESGRVGGILNRRLKELKLELPITVAKIPAHKNKLGQSYTRGAYE